MVKPLSFKGDKKPKKRKRPANPDDESGEPSKQVTKLAGEEDGDVNDDTWVSAEAATDIVGPVMIVLPTEPPSALSCDPAGSVFTIPIENIVDKNPASSEPHDVRMVWVANKIAGTGKFRFKGHNGRFLSCDKVGSLGAASEAVSPLEMWDVFPTADTPGTFQMQTQRETYLLTKDGGKAPEIRGDADAVSFGTTLRIRMQARFKPKIKAGKEEKALAKISRKELEEAAGRRLEEDEVRMLKKARKDGSYHEVLLDLKVKGKHDKWG
ncbi:uncharacterized protein J7T54_008352 [Emericellopsis cladophorae]|uniref:Uncharacterized protein n=1 Tax=Emericellopsis cladophorae TaxID=2686198 RepID=A0A9P9Y2Q4_9HYPO|nr:uncharacterized protein J7T54_008352 [Emericellopsis cladophorae]KAI6782266.1 hypothetical protein J7T54_008352 [Emericellopsis cladophorae]